MAISSLYTADTYSGNGATTSFAITFDYLSDSDNIKVSTKVVSTGVITERTVGVDYTVVGSNVVTTSGAVVPSGSQIIIQFDPDYLQHTDYAENGPLPAETLEADLDKLTLEMQIEKDNNDRSIRFDPTVTGVNPEIVASSTLANNADKYLKLNGDGDGWEIFTLSSSAGLGNIVDDTSPQLGGNLDTNGFLVDGRDIATDGTKLDGIEAGADVTDETSVKAAIDGMVLTGVTVATGDKVLIQDVSDADNLKTVTTQSIADLFTPTFTASSTDTLTNKTLDADGTGNVITNIGSSEIKSEIISGQTLVTAAVGDHVLIGDASDSDNLKKVTVQTIVDLATGSVTASSTDTFTNKTIDADGTGNVITNIGSSEIKSEIVTGQSTVTADGADYLIISDSSDAGNLKKVLASDLMAGGGLMDVVDDTSPSLGGNLDLNSHDITGTGNISLTGTITSSLGFVSGPDSSVGGFITFYEATSNGFNFLTAKIPDALGGDRVLTFPDATDTLVGKATTDVFTNKTVTDCKETVATPTVTAGAVTISLANGTMQKVVTAQNTTITLPSAVAGTSYTVIVQYGGTHTITWAGGGTLKWAGGTTPTATSVNGKYDIYVFVCHDATNTFGSDGGRNY